MLDSTQYYCARCRAPVREEGQILDGPGAGHPLYFSRAYTGDHANLKPGPVLEVYCGPVCSTAQHEARKVSRETLAS